MSFIFGGNTGMTYEEAQRKRALAEALMGQAIQSAPQNIGQGWTAIGQALAGRIAGKKADKADRAGKAEADGLWGKIWGGALGSQPGGMSASSAGSPSPYVAKQTPQDAIGDDAMRALGRSPLGPGGLDFGAVEQQYGLPSGYLHRTGQIESGLNPNAKNPNSSAGGLFQFIDSTAADYGLANKFDPMQSTDAAARLARDNAGYLRNLLGREPSAAELYLAHQQGAGGAGKLLANPQARAVDVVGADAVRLNGGNMDMTAGEFANLWLGKFGDTGVQTQNAAPGGLTMSAAGGDPMSAMPVQANPMDAMDPALLMEALANPYMNDQQKSVIGTLLQQKLAPPDPMADIELQKAQLELQQMQNPGQQLPPDVQERMMLAEMGGLQPGTPEYQQFILNGKTGGGADMPAGFQTLALQAEAAGLKPGTPEYQDFMATGGGSGVPAAFTALDMQANAAGFEDGTPEYQQFMATRGAGLAAQATAEGQAAGEMAVAAPAQVEQADRTLSYIDEVRKHPGLDMGTGGSSWTGAIPGTDSYGFQTRVRQLAGGAFLAAIDDLRGMGALSNTEGAAATAAIGRLDVATSKDEFLEALADYEDIVKKGRERAQKRLPGGQSEGQTAGGQGGLSADDLKYLGVE